MAHFEVIEREGLNLVKVTLNNEMVRTEAGAMYYMRGDVKMESKMPSAGGFLKSMVTGESIFRPTYTGTGELYLEPSFASFHSFDCGGQEWMIQPGGYWASEQTIQIDIHRDKVMTSFLSGKGLLNFWTKVKGNGKVVLVAPGPVEEIVLNNDRLVVDGQFAVAWQGSLDYRVEKATKSLLGSATSGEFLVSTYTGSGKLLLAPVPNWRKFLLDQVHSSLHSMAAKG
ncbi:MAG: AIM24 family protein [Candidatus Sericytochromatia bacterium]